MRRYKLYREERQCDQCKRFKPFAETKSVGNPVIHAKDMLVFCKDTNCEANYFKENVDDRPTLNMP